MKQPCVQHLLYYGVHLTSMLEIFYMFTFFIKWREFQGELDV
jgi:hypothetical protein